MEVRAELIQELREKFLRKLEDEGPPDTKGFHPADIARIKSSDDWLKRFLEHNECNMQESLTMLWESCTWRKKFGANDITEDNIRKDYLEEGFCFAHGKDKDGKQLFIIKSKLHIKGAKDFLDVQKCIVYWFERLERQTNGNQISLFFDMAETGLSNMDMELTKYLIGLFKTYYPSFLNNIIVFEMPWVLNAAFKLIKTWLPPKAVPKIKFVNKSNLKEYVDPSEALKCWGGNNEYSFVFVSEARNESDGPMNGSLANKKVHFAEGSPMTEESPTGFGGSFGSEDKLLAVESPTITFIKTDNEIAGSITLRNITADKPLSFKIKTTSPEKFRVRPPLGILQPQEQRVIAIVLQQGYTVRKHLVQDKFQVMCLPLKSANPTTQELAALWKPGRAAEEHRLVCDGDVESSETQKFHSSLYSGASSSDRNADDAVSSKISNLERMVCEARHDITVIKYSLWLLIVLVFCVGLFGIYTSMIDINFKHAGVCEEQLAWHI